MTTGTAFAPDEFPRTPSAPLGTAMNSQTFRRYFGIAAITSAIVLTAGTAAAQHASTPGMSTGRASGHASEKLNHTMMNGMKHMQGMKMSGDTDKDFAMMMKMHHQQGIDMAQVELDHGKSPELKAKARKIIDEQKKEIAELERLSKKLP